MDVVFVILKRVLTRSSLILGGASSILAPGGFRRIPGDWARRASSSEQPDFDPPSANAHIGNKLADSRSGIACYSSRALPEASGRFCWAPMGRRYKPSRTWTSPSEKALGASKLEDSMAGVANFSIRGPPEASGSFCWNQMGRLHWPIRTSTAPRMPRSPVNWRIVGG